MSRHRQGSVVGTALSLMTSTVLSAGLTFGFWVAAARFFAPDAVGRISAQVASMTLLAAVAQLNLHTLYARFLPTAGRHTGRLVLGGYAASTVMATGLSFGYLALGLDAGVVGDGLRDRLLFTAGVIATGIFLIQDGVLTALRRASSVPLKNIASAAGKLLLLPALAGGNGLLLAWVLPVAAVMVLWNGWILVRLVPKHAAWRRDGARIEPGEVLRFASAEYVNGIVNNVVAFLPPLLVTYVLGTARGAYFYLPWVIGVSVTTMLWHVVSSFVTEASTAEATGARVDRHVRRAVTMVAAVAGGGGLVLAAAAEPLLTVLGAEYAANGTTALRLIGLSLPFTGVIVLYGAFALMEKRMWRMTAIQLCGAVAFLAAAWSNLPSLADIEIAGLTVNGTGLAAPAVALLLAQATVALFLLPGLVSRYRAAQRAVAGADQVPIRVPRVRSAPVAVKYPSDITVLSAPRSSAW